jgi:hypothetical protein
MKFIFFLACSFLLFSTVTAQPQLKKGLIRYDECIYRLSDDGTRLAFLNKTEGQGLHYTALDLRNFTVQDIKVPTCIAYKARLNGDFKNYFVNYFSFTDHKPCPEFDKADWYYTSVYYGQVEKPVPAKQFTDSLFAIAMVNEGLVVSKPVYYGDKRLNNYASSQLNKLIGLKIINPSTGELIRNLTDVVVCDSTRPAYDGGNNCVVRTSDDYVYLQPTGQWKVTFFFPLDGSKPFVTELPTWISRMYGKYGLYSSIGIHQELRIYNVTTGSTILDTVFKSQNGTLACIINDTLWTFDHQKASLTKEMIINDKLYPLNEFRLDTVGVDFGNNNHEAIISKGRLIVFPKTWRRPGEPGNKLYIWDIKSGKMVLMIEDFYSPDANFLAIQDANKAYWAKWEKEEAIRKKEEQEKNRVKSCEEKIREAKFKAGDYIVVADLSLSYGNYKWALVTAYNCVLDIYDVVYMTDSKETKRDIIGGSNWKKGKVPYRRCSCNGNSSWEVTSREQVGWEQVNFNVYVNDPNKTKLVTRKVVCSECNGPGWVKNN